MLLTRAFPVREYARTATSTPPARADVPMDAHRDDTELLLQLDLPGVSADSIDLEVERHILTVTAQRPAPAHSARPVHTERPTGTLARRLHLGETLDTDNISAAYTDGVLTLRVPVADKAKPRKILLDQSGTTA